MTYQVTTYFLSAGLFFCKKTETIKKTPKINYYKILTEIKVIKPAISSIVVRTIKHHKCSNVYLFVALYWSENYRRR